MVNSLPQSSPINGETACSASMLHHDILWKIFSMNADMNNDQSYRVYLSDPLDDWTTRALVTTWNCTHVCRQWRELIIGASSLWGNLLDLDTLSFIKSDYREEILTRTGESPLSVKGKVFGQNRGDRELLILIIKSHWRRIRIFRVAVSALDVFPISTWDPFYLPSPALELFRFRTADDLYLKHSSETRDPQQIFGNDAPRLYSFTSWKLSSFLTTDLDWFAQIRHLDVSYLRSTSISRWIQILGKMPLLQTFSLLYSVYPVPDPSWPDTLPVPVSLPHLEQISVSDHPTSCALLLDHIIPKIGSVLSMYTPHGSTDTALDAAALPIISRVITRYTQNWLQTRTPKNLSLNILHQSVQLSERRHISGPVPPHFEIDLQCVRIHDFTLLLSLLRAYLPCDFSSVTELDMFIDLFHFQSLNDNVFDLFQSLPAVEKLTFTQGDTFQHFWKFVEKKNVEDREGSSPPTLLFSSLQTINIAERHGSSILLTLDSILAFVKFRKSIKAPILVVDLTEWMAVKEEELRYFEVIQGLKIVYRDERLGDAVRDKICGSLW